MLIEKQDPKDTFFLKNKFINCKGNLLNLDESIIMGILNCTPDSFFDGKLQFSDEEILSKTKKMLQDGASIIDIGGYSTRPNANEVSEKEELQRVLPVIKLLTTEFPEAIFSIDTFRSSVAEKCVEHGAAIINDISGGDFDKKMIDCVAQLKVPYILMHSNTDSIKNIHQTSTSHNMVEEVIDYFSEKINLLRQKGINDIIIDPGFGFGKTVQQNYQLLRHLNDFKLLEIPLLVGVSRKSMINKVIGTTPEEALNGTTVLNTVALLKGASILRVHDVKEANQAIKLIGALKSE